MRAPVNLTFHKPNVVLGGPPVAYTQAVTPYSRILDGGPSQRPLCECECGSQKVISCSWIIFRLLIVLGLSFGALFSGDADHKGNISGRTIALIAVSALTSLVNFTYVAYMTRKNKKICLNNELVIFGLQTFMLTPGCLLGASFPH